jgi:hypothetical protein
MRGVARTEEMLLPSIAINVSPIGRRSGAIDFPLRSRRLGAPCTACGGSVSILTPTPKIPSTSSFSFESRISVPCHERAIKSQLPSNFKERTPIVPSIQRLSGSSERCLVKSRTSDKNGSGAPGPVFGRFSETCKSLSWEFLSRSMCPGAESASIKPAVDGSDPAVLPTSFCRLLTSFRGPRNEVKTTK